MDVSPAAFIRHRGREARIQYTRYYLRHGNGGYQVCYLSVCLSVCSGHITEIAEWIWDLAESLHKDGGLSRTLRLAFWWRSSQGTSQGSCGTVNVELIERCIENLKKGKTSGLDGLMAEYVSFAHQVLIVHLSFLFSLNIVWYLMLLAVAWWSHYLRIQMEISLHQKIIDVLHLAL